MAMRAWKVVSICGLLALCLVVRATAGSAPAAFPGAAGERAAAPAAPASDLEAGPLAALLGTGGGGLPGSCNTPADSALTPSCSGGVCAETFLASRVCSFRFCQGSGSCICSNGQHGTCSNGLCRL
jgi:hypothetical protein